MPVAYPSALPLAQATKTREQAPAFGIARPRRGLGYVEPIGTASPSFWSLTWRLTGAQAQVFLEWFNTDLERGFEVFTMAVRTEFGLVNQDLQFLPDGLMRAEQIGGDLWEYSADVMTGALSGVPTGCLISDASYASVRLLLRGQGTNGGTTFTDSGPTGYTQTGFVNATTSNEQALECFGPLSIKLTAGYVSFTTTIGSMAASAFTAEAWVRPASSGAMGIMALRAPIARGWAMQSDSFRAMIDGTWSDAHLVPTPPAVGQWSHLAVTHNGSGLYTYWRNGVAEDTATFGTGVLDNVGASVFVVGASSDSGEAPFTGHLYARVTFGVCRYTATFTPPNNFPATA